MKHGISLKRDTKEPFFVGIGDAGKIYSLSIGSSISQLTNLASASMLSRTSIRLKEPFGNQYTTMI